MRDDHQEFPGSDGERSDTASESDPLLRQSVGGPYRDRRDALVLQRRRLAAELDDAERSIERAERARRHLRVLDPELARASAPWIHAIRIETPCREDWSAMRGTDAVRSCDRCRRQVYDLARMTRDEIETLFARAGATPCVRMRRRPDGRIATADCPTERSGLASRALGVLAGAALGATAAVAVAVALAPRPGEVVLAAACEPRRVIAAPPRVPPVVHVSALRAPPEPEPDEDATSLVGAAVATPPQPITAADLEAHLRWIAPQAWEIDRVLLDRALTAGSSIDGRLRPMPHESEGRVDGVTIYGVRAESSLARLGIRNGDTILDVNGYPIAAPDAALEAYTRLHTADVLFVRILRRGEERVHVYRIVSAS